MLSIRNDGGRHYFTKEELSGINESSNINFGYGYCFLDNDTIEKNDWFPHIKEEEDQFDVMGMVRLETGNHNPKWSFWIEEDKLRIYLA